ncbi:uncharacterized protein LOC126846039 [Adelges cooleyi]|uniref:uncharacterized protein LOC126846039 n=1 Tax=Adelges cooleyi TaxID=133065 RepID=UPI00217F8023|nr:uncharacterized protein LOC126846039 [Adelges cooleyi]XP_050441079.1 uncharacterized protein LOC126846039 [Adelges cooleyi]XP_050441080.1 uncharacterized protein LOC126846039 [Adelges cooleyi]
MKFYSFLISFIFVNVSTYDIKDYIKEVCVTNAHIEHVFNMNNFRIRGKFELNGLEYVVKTFVEQGLHSIGPLNNMFAVPEFRLYTEWDELIETQAALRELIQSKLSKYEI